MNRTSRIILVLLAMVAILAGCSKDNSIGGGVEDVGEGQDQNRIGATSSTTTPPDTQKPTETTAAPTTAKPAVTQPPKQAAPCTKFQSKGAIEEFIKIGDANQKIDPVSAGFRKGAKVCWKNVDSVPHGIQANDGTFSSGPIAPGAVFEWVANKTGRINYQDPDRPFIVAELQIQ